MCLIENICHPKKTQGPLYPVSNNNHPETIDNSYVSRSFLQFYLSLVLHIKHVFNISSLTSLLPLVLPRANSFPSHPGWEWWALLSRLRWEKGWSPASSTICSKGPLLDALNRQYCTCNTDCDYQSHDIINTAGAEGRLTILERIGPAPSLYTISVS